MEKHLERQKAYTMLDKGVRFLCLLVITCVLGTVGQRKDAVLRLYSNLDRYFELWGKPTQLLDATWREEKFPWIYMDSQWIYMDLWLLQLSSSM